MTLWQILIKEIHYRFFGFLLAVVAVALASGMVILAHGILTHFDLSTEALIRQRTLHVAAQADSLQETYRKIGTQMGFNVLILPKEQNLSDLYANDYGSRFMPEWYADTLAASTVITVQHLLPVLQQKITWPEKRRTIILVGTRGEIPLVKDTQVKKMLRDPVPHGEIILGYELHASLQLTKGDTVRLMGRNFKVKDCYTERGNKDDITVWINLAEAQQMVDKKGLISGIMALECNCAMAKIGMIRDEIAGILPNTKVIEFASQALARAESRRKAAEFAQTALTNEKASREKMRADKKNLLRLILVLIIITATVFTGFLSIVNVRARRAEMATLLATGWSRGTVCLLLLGRAGLCGILGSAGGCGIALAALGILYHGVPFGLGLFALLPIVVGGAFLISILAGLVPAFFASRQDAALLFQTSDR